MGTATTLLVQSKFFLPVFNMAIFDGPFRLYFTHSQEAEALRMYFDLHEFLGEKAHPPKEHLRLDPNKALFVLIYPDEQAFRDTFQSDESAAHAWVGECKLVGVKGPVWSQEALNTVMSHIDDIYEEDARPLEISAL